MTDLPALVVTSCNRTRHVALALTLNAWTIKDRFATIVVDSSTEELSTVDAVKWHADRDPYNLVTAENYCTDQAVLRDVLGGLERTERGPTRLIHVYPVQPKSSGDAELMSIGLLAAAQLGCPYALKLTGVSVLDHDLVGELRARLARADVVTCERTHIPGYQRSTRVFGCRPDALLRYGVLGSPVLVQDYEYLEDRFARLLDRHVPLERHAHWTHCEEGSTSRECSEFPLLVDHGVAASPEQLRAGLVHRLLYKTSAEMRSQLDYAGVVAKFLSNEL